MSVQRNTLINLVGAIVPMGVMLVTVPMYLNLLGEARYGILTLVWLVLGYFSFLEMGLGKATANQIAKAPQAPPSQRAEIFWTALSINMAMGVVAAGILWLVGDYLVTHVLEMSDDFRTETLLALPWLAATFPLALTSSVLNGALEGRNQFLALNALQITSNTAFQIVPLLCAWSIESSLAVVIPAAVLTRAFMSLLHLRVCQRTVPLVGRPMPKRSRARHMFAYGGWVAVTAAVGPLLETIERIIIGLIVGASAVTHYTIPMQLAGKVKVIPGALSRAIFPVFSSNTAADGTILAKHALRSLSISMTLLILILLLALRPFLQLWVGESLANIATPIGELLLIGIWFNSIAHIPYFLLQAQGRPDVVAKVHLFEFPFYLAATWLAVNWAGLTGAATVWVLRSIVEAMLLLSFGRLLSTSAHFLLPQGSAVALFVYGLHLGYVTEMNSRIVIAAILISGGAWLSLKRIRLFVKSYR